MIDLFSDTKTARHRRCGGQSPRPKSATSRSSRPDDQSPSERVCELLGKEDALFLPSGTMCNEIAIAVHCRPGDEVVAAAGSHVVDYEGGGPAALAGVMVRAVGAAPAACPAPTMQRCWRAAVARRQRYFPRSRLVCAEQTVNTAGGAIWPLAQMREVGQTAASLGLATHIDGARLMNAVVASGVSAREYAQGYDSVWIDFSKGLAARSARCSPEAGSSSRGVAT